MLHYSDGFPRHVLAGSPSMCVSAPHTTWLVPSLAGCLRPNNGMPTYEQVRRVQGGRDRELLVTSLGASSPCRVLVEGGHTGVASPGWRLRKQDTRTVGSFESKCSRRKASEPPCPPPRCPSATTSETTAQSCPWEELMTRRGAQQGEGGRQALWFFFFTPVDVNISVPCPKLTL